MVFISISISLARRHDAPPVYTESMSSVRHGSISSYSARSHSDTLPPLCLDRGTGTGYSESLERLIPRTSRTTRLLEDRKRVRMATTHENGVLIERKMSYGIGGAGNIRKCFSYGS